MDTELGRARSQSGGSVIYRCASSSALSARRRSRSSRTGRSSTRAARSGAGRVVPAGDVEALAAAARELLEDPDALEAARAGARLARETLTWDAAAEAHLELYRQLV